eukprot:481395_1
MSDLCTEFRKTYRRIDNETTDEAVTTRHIQLYHYARSLLEAVQFYGDEMSTKMKVYHGLNKVMNFPKFTAYFNQPISTSISIRTAQNFSAGIGIILTLKSGSEYVNTSKIPKYLSVSWLSCFPNEDEKLFYGANVVFQIYNIIEAETNKGHLKELSMLNKFQKMLKNQNIKWNDESKMVDALVILIKQQQIINVNENGNNNKNDKQETKYDATIESNNKYITKYGKELFNYFCNNKNTWSVWINDYKSLPIKLQTVLFTDSLHNDDDENKDLLSFVPLTNLFANLKEIRLNELNIQQLTKDSKDYIFAIMEYINNASKSTNAKLIKIILQSKPQKEPKENSTLKNLTSKYWSMFNKWQWTIKYVFELETNHVLMFTNNNIANSRTDSMNTQQNITETMIATGTTMSSRQGNLSYFIQITEVTNEKFTVRLDTANVEITTIKRYTIRDVLDMDQDELAEVSITKNRRFGTDDIYFEDDHDEKYQISLYDEDDYSNKQSLSNIIELTKYPSNMSYPPNAKSNYKPNSVNTVTMSKILDANCKHIRLYWSIPASSYGIIQYKIVYCQDDEEKRNVDKNEEIVKVLPYSVPISNVSINFKIITISIFNKQKYFSEPTNSVNIASINEEKDNAPANPSQTNEELKEKWDETLSYFMQITNINKNNIDVHLISDSTNTKMIR